MASPVSKGRMLNQSISQSRKFASLSADSQVLFCMLIPFFDSHGKQNGEPFTIKGTICKLIDRFTPVKIERMLQEITEKTNVKWWKDEKGFCWLHAKKFHEEQVLRSDRLGKDTFPSFPGFLENERDSDKSGSSPGLVQREVEVEVEVKEKEGRGNASPLSLKKSRARNPKTLIPADWRPSADTLAWCLEKRLPEPEYQVDLFVTYWQGREEARANWDASFRNWMAHPYRKDRPHGQNGRNRGQGGYQSAAERNASAASEAYANASQFFAPSHSGEDVGGFDT